MGNEIRLIAADMDGTLLDSKGRISAYDLEMIQMARSKGIIFAACTGRYPENAAQIMLNAGLQGPVISLNGAVVEIAPNAGRIHELLINEQAGREVFRRLEDLEEGYYIFGRATVASRRDWPRHISESDADMAAILKQKVRYTYGLAACSAALAIPIFKFFVYRSEGGHSLEEIADRLSGIPGIEITQSGVRNIEVMPEGADKGAGLRILSERLGIEQKHTMALGDQMNDLSMITWAGIGVAMGNAIDIVKQAAHGVTCTNEENGVGEAIARYCF